MLPCQLPTMPGTTGRPTTIGLTCPTCCQVTPIPDRGVAGLQSAFHINRLLEIKESLEKLNNQNGGQAAGGAMVDAPPEKVLHHCDVHPGEELKLYCETCNQVICFQCIMKDQGQHHDHDYALFNKAFEKYKEEISPLLEPMEDQVIVVKKALAQIDTRCGEISNQREATKDRIHFTFRQLRAVLDVRETDLISQLDLVIQNKLKGLAAQRDQIETTLTRLNSCLHFMRQSLRTGSEEDVLMMKSRTKKQVQELTIPLQPDTLKPNTEANVVFSDQSDVTTLCQKYGGVFTLGQPDPSRCRITGKGPEVAVSWG